MEATRWQQTEVLAWTDGDGPGPVPSAPSRWVTGSVAATLAVTLFGVLATDALCPDHRTWVQVLASFAIVSATVAIVQVVRGQASAPLFAIVAAALGVAIGAIDAVHDPGRGALIAMGFALAGVGGALVAFRLDQQARWGRALATAHVVVDDGEGAAAAAASAPDARRASDGAGAPNGVDVPTAR